MRWRDLWRQDQTLVVAVRHNKASDHPRRHAPACLPYEFFFIVFVQKLNAEHLGKILSQIMRGAHLQCLAIRHERLNRVRPQGACKTLQCGLLADRDWYGKILLNKLSILFEHPARFLLCFCLAAMCRMPLLPQKLGGADKQSRPQFPAHHVRPLIYEHGQIAPRLNPAGKGRVDDCFGCGADHERLIKLLAACVCHDCKLR